MRFIIGCSLSMIFSASCAYASAPAGDDLAADSGYAETEVDYSQLVQAAIESGREMPPMLGERIAPEEAASLKASPPVKEDSQAHLDQTGNIGFDLGGIVNLVEEIQIEASSASQSAGLAESQFEIAFSSFAE